MDRWLGKHKHGKQGIPNGEGSVSTVDRGHHPPTWMSSEHQNLNVSQTGPPADSPFSVAVCTNSQAKGLSLTLGFFFFFLQLESNQNTFRYWSSQTTCPATIPSHWWLSHYGSSHFILNRATRLSRQSESRLICSVFHCSSGSPFTQSRRQVH